MYFAAFELVRAYKSRPWYKYFYFHRNVVENYKILLRDMRRRIDEPRSNVYKELIDLKRVRLIVRDIKK